MRWLQKIEFASPKNIFFYMFFCSSDIIYVIPGIKKIAGNHIMFFKNTIFTFPTKQYSDCNKIQYSVNS